MSGSTVAVFKTSPSTLVEDIRSALAAAEISKWDAKAPTYIKMNGNYDRHYPGSNTSPWFMDALLKVLCDEGFDKLTVIEGDLPYFTADQMIQRTGMIEILNRYGVPFHNYEHDERDENKIPKMLLDAQVVNVPVPHGHGFAVVSCAVKNLFGLLPNPRRKYHRRLSETILMLNEKVRPLTIVDATVGLIGPSTRRGKPIRMDLVIAGADAVAIDVLLSEMMGYGIEQIPHLKLAQDKGLVAEIALAGDYQRERLPRFLWPLQLDAGRALANWLESTWVEDLTLFQAVENLLERLYHHITFLRNRKMLFSGPWMEYERAMKDRLSS